VLEELESIWEEMDMVIICQNPDIRVEKLRSTTRNLEQESPAPDRGPKHLPPDYDAGVLVSGTECSST
jgi:hypothetical protein